jgi:hypothetical protein
MINCDTSVGVLSSYSSIAHVLGPLMTEDLV